MDINMLVVWVCVAVVAVLGGSDGLMWTEESTAERGVIQTCLGEEVSLPWQFITEANETLVNVEWYKHSDGMETIVATFNGGKFFRSSETYLKLSLLSNAGLHVANLTWADYGTYSVRVKVVQSGGELRSISREAVISPPDVPVLAGDRLVAQRVHVPVTDNVTGELHVQLKCGTFLALGSRPLSVVWKTPSGQTVPSTDRSADSFFLTLDNPIEGGTYSCHIDNDTGLQACVKNAQSMSYLKRGAFVQLDEAATQLSILGAQAKTLFSRDQEVRSLFEKEVKLLRQDLQQCSDDLATKVSELREGLSQRDNDVQRQLDVLRVELGKQQSMIAAHNRRVAFAAYISREPYVEGTKSTTVPFEGVITNVGSAYNPVTSAFTAPYDGNYVFFVRVYVHPECPGVQLHKNGQMVIEANNESGGGQHDVVIGGVILTLMANDVITVVLHAAGGHVDKGVMSVFTGFMLP